MVRKLKRQLQLFLTFSLLEFVAANILDSLPPTATRNHCIIILADRYSKLTKAIPTDKIASTQLANTLFNC